MPPESPRRVSSFPRWGFFAFTGPIISIDTRPTIRQSHEQMNAEDTIREILRKNPIPPSRRASHGQWVEAAWVARGLVEKQWTVSDAVRQVVDTLKLTPPDKAFRGIRACYYTIRNKPWPGKQ